MFSRLTTTVLIAATLATLAGGAHAVERTIDLKNIKGPLVPTDHYRGDREFGGNGPYMAIESRLAIVNGGRAIAAYITFDAKEAGGDHSSVRGNWTKVVWRSRDGSRVRRIVSKEHERIADYSKPGRGFEIDMRATGASRYDYGGPLNHLTKSYGYLVGAKVVGDTDGDDISDDRDPRGDTAIYLIEFGEVRVELER